MMVNKSVLVVDDEVAVLNATARTIRMAGHGVEKATDADQALVLCEQHSFDVVILDFMLPKTDGLELLAKIRRIQPGVKSIIVSGKLAGGGAEEQITEQLREQIEADSYLHKPVTSKRLLDAIEMIDQQSGPFDWQDLAKTLVNPERTSLKAARKAAKALRPTKQGQ